MAHHQATGVIAHIIDAGTVVQVGILVGGQMRWLAADGNLFRRAAADYHAAQPHARTLLGLAITFEQTNWGGMQSFSVTTQEPRT
jgi:hypothetical protein